MYICAGERLSDEEVNELLQGHEDSQGNVNYEGLLQQLLFLQCVIQYSVKSISVSLLLLIHHCCLLIYCLLTVVNFCHCSLHIQSHQ